MKKYLEACSIDAIQSLMFLTPTGDEISIHGVSKLTQVRKKGVAMLVTLLFPGFAFPPLYLYLHMDGRL